MYIGSEGNAFCCERHMEMLLAEYIEEGFIAVFYELKFEKIVGHFLQWVQVFPYGISWNFFFTLDLWSAVFELMCLNSFPAGHQDFLRFSLFWYLRYSFFLIALLRFWTLHCVSADVWLWISHRFLVQQYLRIWDRLGSFDLSPELGVFSGMAFLVVGSKIFTNLYTLLWSRSTHQVLEAVACGQKSGIVVMTLFVLNVATDEPFDMFWRFYEQII